MTDRWARALSLGAVRAPVTDLSPPAGRRAGRWALGADTGHPDTAPVTPVTLVVLSLLTPVTLVTGPVPDLCRWQKATCAGRQARDAGLATLRRTLRRDPTS